MSASETLPCGPIRHRRRAPAPELTSVCGIAAPITATRFYQFLAQARDVEPPAQTMAREPQAPLESGRVLGVAELDDDVGGVDACAFAGDLRQRGFEPLTDGLDSVADSRAGRRRVMRAKVCS